MCGASTPDAAEAEPVEVRSAADRVSKMSM